MGARNLYHQNVSKEWILRLLVQELHFENNWTSSYFCLLHSLLLKINISLPRLGLPSSSSGISLALAGSPPGL